MKISTRFALPLAMLMLTGSAVALAAPSDVEAVATKTVNLRDLNLASADGASTLYSRIASAARTVCRDTDRHAMRVCRAQAIDDAVSRVGNPLLSSIHRSASDRVVEVVSR